MQHVESNLPPVWEQERTFHDDLNDWMERTPWLAVSLGVHFIAYFLLLAMPWSHRETPVVTEITSSVVPPVEAPEDPPIPPIEQVLDAPVDDPTLMPVETPSLVESDSFSDLPDSPVEAESTSTNVFDSIWTNPVLGSGGGASGKFGPRGPGGRGKGTRGSQLGVEQGLKWLRDHQSEDGSWDVDEYFVHNVRGGTDCREGAGIASQDVGITGLALLAFLAEGSSTRQGEYKEVVRRGIEWLSKQQDPDTGLIGAAIGHAFLYDHAIATLAMAENYYDSRSPFQKKQTQLAVNFIGRARAPYGGWRYEAPSDGDTDTSVTGWMIFALRAAEDAKLRVDREGYQAALAWLDSVTDPATGRVGYIGPERGGRSSRTEVNADYPAEETEAMTGVGLLTRVFLGQTPDQNPILLKHGDLMLRTLPEWDEARHKVDMYYWYYGTYAMYQLGGEHWRKWKAAMERAILPHQRTDGDYKGSWDPVGPWGYQGGRVYSTATMVLTMQVYYRYSRVLGGR
ncbi:MAG: terpene cyclase/mutase family protein [Planctomycetes bacterium]|nr:terpene cyclase/mutase family protein [Planctomycetota bacterium]MCB9909659.1 terpene cyclase/mutase family protein [Planctomycetota bacterium]MCB9911852.1 terpene cyclase/mutase family protein [Planctomycetota bacterium]HPF14830.1 terpene cyclase/mutase family protein [Planctomycetota bacterium]